MTDVFTTVFNHDISLRPGYREKLPPVYDLDERETIYDIENKAEKESEFGIFSDIFQAAMMIDWLRKWQPNKKTFKRHLDIGGSTGLIAGLFKAAGISEQAYCLDNHDARNALDHDDVRRVLGTINRAREVLSLPEPKHEHGAAQTVRHNLNALTQMYPYDIWRGGEPDFSSAFWHFPKQSDFSLDDYHWGDYYKLDSKYDLLTAFSSMDHFSLKPFFSKAYQLLEPGGEFYIWAANWYCPLTSTFVFMDFPFGCQRLLRSDVARYFSKHHPDELRKILRAYDYWHQGDPGQVASDYINIACDAGFQPLNEGRLVFPEGVPKAITSFEFSGDHGVEMLREVLRDVHCFKPNVTMLDLTTQSYLLAFRKP